MFPTVLSGKPRPVGPTGRTCFDLFSSGRTGDSTGPWAATLSRFLQPLEKADRSARPVGPLVRPEMLQTGCFFLDANYKFATPVQGYKRLSSKGD